MIYLKLKDTNRSQSFLQMFTDQERREGLKQYKKPVTTKDNSVTTKDNSKKKKNAASCNLFSGYIPRAIYSSIWSFLPDSVIWPNKIQLPNKCVSLGIMLLGEGPASLWSQIMWPVLRSHQRGQPQAFRIHRVFRLKHVFLFRGKNFLGKNLYHLPIEF